MLCLGFQKLPDAQPHVFALALAAFTAMTTSGKSQSCVISGVSGAGKTESSKNFVRHILALSDADAGTVSGKTSDSTKLVHKIGVMSGVIEAFGNAKTELNPNSSRFGQYIALMFGPSGEVVRQARIST